MSDSKQPLPLRACKFCGDMFRPNAPKQLYDTADCRMRAARQKAYDKRQAERAERERDAALDLPDVARQ